MCAATATPETRDTTAPLCTAHDDEVTNLLLAVHDELEAEHAAHWDARSLREDNG